VQTAGGDRFDTVRFTVCDSVSPNSLRIIGLSQERLQAINRHVGFLKEKGQLSADKNVIHMERSDKELVSECLAGSQEAFGALVDRYQKVVFNVAYRMTNDYDAADDITQSVFIKGFEKMSSFNAKFKFFSWLYRIAVNESLNYINRNKRTEELSPDLRASQKTPEQAYSDAEVSEKVEDALMQLDPKYRIVVVLKHFRDCSYREIGDILQIPEKTVKSRLFTARQLLKSILVERGIIGNGW
jgi:RNA polymerase sigma-70 factor (ECF subfamily)